MQETILALGALLIITLIAINHQRSTILIQEQVYLREISHARDDLGIKLLQSIVNEEEFDENTKNISSIPTDLSILTPAAGFGPDSGEHDMADFDDIDDYHGYRTTVTHVISADTFRFDVDFSVYYLTPQDSISSVQTVTKEIVLNMASVNAFGDRTVTGQFSITALVTDNL